MVVVADYSTASQRPIPLYNELDVLCIRAGAWSDYYLTAGRNAGRPHVETKLMCTLDADCVLAYSTLHDAVTMFGDPPYHPLLIGQRVSYIQENGNHMEYPWNGKIISGGFMVYRVQDFDAVGGFNPFIRGWGFEDQDFTMRMAKAGVRPTMLPGYYYHLWHPPELDREAKVKEEAENMRIAGASEYRDGKWGWKEDEK